MENRSGIYPVGDRVLIKPDSIEEVTPGGIVIANKEKYELAQSLGTLVAIGPEAWITEVTRDGEGRITEVIGPLDSPPSIGDRVAFEKYGGLQMPGKDGETYRLMRYQGISAIVDSEVDFSELSRRKSFSEID